MQKAKRGRKPKSEKINVTDVKKKESEDNIKTIYKVNETFDGNCSDSENIIMKLNINSVTSNELLDNNLMLDGYNVENKDYACYESYSQKDDSESLNSESIIDEKYTDTSFNNLKVVQLLKDFEEKNKQNEWPISTSICCYWCCHSFKNTPFGIPVKYINGKFFVYGCFCSLECAAAYNNGNKNNMDEMLERYALINLFSRKINYKTVVKPAPQKLNLTMFGGQQTIEEFRKFTSSNKLTNINFPPMMTIVQQLEEINESEINSDYKYIPLDNDRIKKYTDELRLKRSKPVNNYKNTLDHAMNLKYSE
jgi:hypothetical protein